MGKLIGAAALLAVLAGCSGEGTAYFQGYVEGEFVYVASPRGGRLLELAVARGDTVGAGRTLFVLESSPEDDQRAQAQAQLDSARSQLEDKKKGLRPHEIAALEAQVGQNAAGAEIARLEKERLEPLHEKNFVSDNDYDQARLTHVQAVEAVAQSREQVAQGRLGAREDQVQAAAAQVRAQEAALAEAVWRLEEKTQFTVQSALVFDTLYRVGEYVAPGNPVVALLPPGNIKIRFFVPEDALRSLKRGLSVRYRLQGDETLREAVVDYISPEAEYTPPVIFSRDNSSKLVYMVEALPAGPIAGLDPGQPLEVYPPASAARE
ncbi:MAG TPA: HlyD family efflux transporter periplasmic adaptor subunit [bacterium]|nr:HlyD family efflux transporter periplasmic adaptor subunit [bacterium]HPQ66043.1 HlyD family efflux transporter periplasmic adaptor subunit [bacterium]